MDLAGLIFAFTAGMLSLLSPCGYALLPGYISYHLGSELPVRKAILGGLLSLAGLATVFSCIGFLSSIANVLLSQLIPLLELVAAVVIIFMGVSILVKIKIPSISMLVKAPKQKGLIGLYVFGVAYGLAGVGCSAPIFFSILAYAVAVEEFLSSIITFLVYTIGMGAPLILTSILVAEAKKLTIERIAKATPWLQKFCGVFLILVGVYLLYFYYITYA